MHKDTLTLRSTVWLCCCNIHVHSCDIVAALYIHVYCETLWFSMEANKMILWLLWRVPVTWYWNYSGVFECLLWHFWSEDQDKNNPQYMYLSIFMFNISGVVELWFFKLLKCYYFTYRCIVYFIVILLWIECGLCIVWNLFFEIVELGMHHQNVDYTGQPFKF